MYSFGDPIRAAPDETGLHLDSGAGALDETFRTALLACRLGRELMAADLTRTATNLRAARDAYEASDVRSRELFDNLLHADPLAGA